MRRNMVPTASLLIAIAIAARPAVAGSVARRSDPQASVAATSAPTVFAVEIAAAKAAMMAAPEEARRHAQAAHAAAQGEVAGSERQIATATASWLSAEALTRLGQPDAALAQLEPALEVIARVAPGSRLQGDALKSHGRASEALGHVQHALEDFQAAFRIYQRAKEPRSEAIALQEIGSIYSDARDYPSVLKYNALSREIYSLDPVLNLTTHNNRAVALKDMGRPAQADVEFGHALRAAVDLHSPHLQAGILASMGYAELQAGRVGAARANVARGLALAAHDVEAGNERPFLTGVQAAIDARSGDDEAAARRLDEVFAGRDLTTTPMAFRDFHEIAAAVYERTGDQAKALAHLKAFKRLDDEGRSLAASTNAALIAARFDFATQNLRITALKAGELERDVALARSAARLHDVIAVGVLVGGGLMLALAALGLLGMRRSRDRVRSANARLGVANTALEKALKAKGEFLATTSHEIRTPLNGVLGMAQIILSDVALQPQVRERVQLLQDAGETMRLLVDDLLDMAKLETGGVSVSQAPFDLPEALGKANRFWSGQAAVKGLQVHLEIDPALGWILGDERRVSQIVFNLMSNALKFTDSGSVTLRAVAAGDSYEVSVSDTGIGVPADQQAAIFDAFVQVDSGRGRAHGGTGLGLSICRKIAHAMGGEIAAATREGGGSVFTLRAPLVIARPAVRVEPVVASASTDLSRSAVLVLDANPIGANVLRALLQARTARVALATDLVDARSQMQACGFDLLLAERATLRAGGATLANACAEIRAQHSGVKLALIAPAAELEDADTLVQAGLLDAVLAKPIATEALVALLEAVLARGAPASVALAA